MEKKSSFDSIYDIPTKVSHSSEKLFPAIQTDFSEAKENPKDELKEDDEDGCEDSSFLYDYLPPFANKPENQNGNNNLTNEVKSIEKTELQKNSQRYSSGVFSQGLSMSNLDPEYDVIPMKVNVCKTNSSTSDLKNLDAQTSDKYFEENIETFDDDLSKLKTCFITSELDRIQFDKCRTYIKEEFSKKNRTKPIDSYPKPKLNDKEPIREKGSLKKNISKSSDFISDLGKQIIFA